MKNRKQRVELIVDLIRTKCIPSQVELLKLIAERGFHVTQATLSRDLKLLKITKMSSGRGKFMYILPDSNLLKDNLLKSGDVDLNTNCQGGFISLQISGNMAVIKTRNGYAAGLAYDMDISNRSEILGTIPGSDTIFCVMREGMTHDEIRKVFASLVPLDRKIPVY